MATSIVSIAVVLLVLGASLAWRQQRRLAVMQTQLDTLSRSIRTLEAAHESLLVRFMNLPRVRKARKSSSGSSDSVREKSTAPTQLDEKNAKGSALYVVAPKTSPE